MANVAFLLVAHGSRDPAWAAPFEQLARTSGARLAFMELGSPSIAEAASAAIAEGAAELRILPLFMAVGRHVRHDIPAAADNIRAAHPGVTVTLLPSLGEDARFWEALAAIVRAEMALP